MTLAQVFALLKFCPWPEMRSAAASPRAGAKRKKV
jgi:hypothetical protein